MEPLGRAKAWISGQGFQRMMLSDHGGYGVAGIAGGFRVYRV